MAGKKMTIIEKYTAIQQMLSGEYKGDFTAEQAQHFLEERIAQTLKKNATKPKALTEKQKTNNGIKDQIYDYLVNCRIARNLDEISKEVPSCLNKSNQYITQMLVQLKWDNKVTRSEKKGKAYYQAVIEE